MKNSKQTGIGTSIRWSVSILTMFATLALTNAAKAADFKGTPSNAGANVTVTNSTIPVPASEVSQGDTGAPRLEASLHLFAEQTGLFCYTNLGVFRMLTWSFPGSSCFVQLGYTTVWGVVGY